MNRTKIELNNFYHVYNRGVEKRSIFLDNEDRSMFMHHLFALNNSDSLSNLPRNRKKKIQRKPLVTIHGFCLMDNHYHLLLEQIVENGISKFMQKIGTGYTMYFNTTHFNINPTNTIDHFLKGNNKIVFMVVKLNMMTIFICKLNRHILNNLFKFYI